jgi:hypothetical protein
MANRELAIDVLRETVDTEVPVAGPAQDPHLRPFNPVAFGIPAFMMGGVLIFLFPIVGLALFAIGAGATLFGMGMAILESFRGRRARKDEGAS